MDRRRSSQRIFVHRTVHLDALRWRYGTQEAATEGSGRHPPAGRDLPDPHLRRVRPGDRSAAHAQRLGRHRGRGGAGPRQAARASADNTAARTNVTLGYLLDEWLSGHEVEETTRASYRLLIESFLRPALGTTPLAQLCRQGPRPFKQLHAELRVCPHRTTRKKSTRPNVKQQGDRDVKRQPGPHKGFPGLSRVCCRICLYEIKRAACGDAPDSCRTYLPSGRTTTLSAALAGRARSWPGRTSTPQPDKARCTRHDQPEEPDAAPRYLGFVSEIRRGTPPPPHAPGSFYDTPAPSWRGCL